MINLNLNKKRIFNTVKNTFFVISGTVILAVGCAVFLFPFGLVTGGISGLAIIIEHVIGGFINSEIIATLLTWLTFFIGFIAIGKAFAIKTLVSTLVYPLALSLSSLLVAQNVLNGYFILNPEIYGEVGYIIASIAGGALVGIGCSLSFIGGGSTGGTDVFAFLLCKIFPKLKSSRAIFIIDAAIIALGAVVMKDLALTLLGICSAFVAAAVIDKLFLGSEKAFIANIISEHADRISELIIRNLGRTTSIIDITGGFSGKKKRMLMVSFTMSEYSELIKIIDKTDTSAFITIHPAHEIGGNGWTR